MQDRAQLTSRSPPTAPFVLALEQQQAVFDTCGSYRAVADVVEDVKLPAAQLA